MVVSQIYRQVGDQTVPRNVVLLLHRGELILATPSQLRPASESEKAMHELNSVAPNMSASLLEGIRREAKYFLDLTDDEGPGSEAEDRSEQERADDSHPGDSSSSTDDISGYTSSPDASGTTPSRADFPEVDELLTEVMRDDPDPEPRRLESVFQDVPEQIREALRRPAEEAQAGEDQAPKRARIEDESAMSAFWALGETENIVEASVPMDKADLDKFIKSPMPTAVAAVQGKRA